MSRAYHIVFGLDSRKSRPARPSLPCLMFLSYHDLLHLIVINLFQTDISCRQQLQISNFFFFFQILKFKFHYHIWIQHEKCIQMCTSTNKPSLGSVVFEKNIVKFQFVYTTTSERKVSTWLLSSSLLHPLLPLHINTTWWAQTQLNNTMCPFCEWTSREHPKKSAGKVKIDTKNTLYMDAS